jgi:hypothetical protein
MRRVALALAITAATALGHGVAPATGQTLQCGQVTVDLGTGDMPAGGSAVDIRATRISCERARSVARACFRGSLRGWKVRRAGPENAPRVLLGRGAARVSFAPAGGGGCFA